MTHRLMIAVAAVTLMAATGFANAQDAGSSRDAPSAAAPARQPRTETLSTRHADPTADRTVGESMKPEKNSGDSDLAAAVRIDQRMSRESEGGLGHRRGR